MKKKGLMAIGLLTVLLNANAQDVSNYTPGSLPEGVVYYLPKTVFEVEVKVSQTNYTPGELCQYADRYLRLQNISSKPSERWEIKSIDVKAIGVPDTAKAYAVKLKEKAVTAEMELTPDGIIKAINTTSPTPKEIDKKKTPAVTAPSKQIDPRSFMTEEMLMAGSSNKMAELIAKEIYSIRESKNSLNRGQADYMPKDGAALKIMLNNLEEQEKAMTEMFAGVTTYNEHTYTFRFEPKEEVVGQVLFRFSKKSGVLQADNLAGEPIYISLGVRERIIVPTEAENQKKKVEGIIYNIPGKGKIYIESSEQNFFEGEFPITQFGETEVLVNSLFTKKVNTRVIFNPVTGGISKIDKD